MAVDRDAERVLEMARLSGQPPYETLSAPEARELFLAAREVLAPEGVLEQVSLDDTGEHMAVVRGDLTRPADVWVLHQPLKALSRGQDGRSRPALSFGSDQGFRAHAEKIASDLLARGADAGERAQKRAVVRFCRSMGQVPEKRVRC